MIVRITGGLGNQMFQYSLKKKMDLFYKSPNYIDLSFFETKKIHNNYELERVFGIKDNVCIPSAFYLKINTFINHFAHILSIPFVRTFYSLSETKFGFYDRLFSLPYNENFILDGYWQSESYFRDIRQELLKAFEFPELDEVNKKLLSSIPDCFNLVSIHVRRGDYLTSSMYCRLSDTDYYKNAIEFIKTNVSNPYYLIFSDDTEWCRNYFSDLNNVSFVDWNKGMDSFRDMQLMSLCEHNIIANSSFSWWGAWLNRNTDKIVVSPKHFYTIKSIREDSLIPESWTKL